MAYEELCMYCFEDRQGQVICPHCGRDSRAAVPQIQMLPGTLVYNDRFLVGRALGQDATGIVYSAYDTKRESKLKLREYLPRDCAERLNDGSVVPAAGLEDQFEKGMSKLRASVEGVDDPKKRHFYFEENGTAYIAQRKSADGAAAQTREHYRDDEDDDRRSGARQLGLIIGGAAAVVVIAVIVIISMVNGALRNADDVIQNPTLAPSASNALWAPAETPTPTPYVSPTFAALVDPEQSWMDYTYAGDVNQDFDDKVSQSSTATPRPTIRPETTKNPTVNNKSDAVEITKLQQRLASLGWLSPNGITGKYDSATKRAVKDFQNYVNTAIKPNPKLDVDGIAGPITQQWLYGTDSVRPTAAPTPAVTPDPNQQLTVDKNSPKNDIKAVQRKLIVLGLMKKGSDDGVYGNTTTAAVKKFQQRVNQLQGYNALPITGTVDPDTMAYLNYYVEWWENLQQATATPEPVLPTTPTPVPTAEPTDAPTPVPTEIPDKEETGTVVDKNSPKESIAFVQEMLIGVGLLPEGSNDGVYGAGTSQAVQAFQEWVNAQLGFGTVPVTGVADQNTLNYLEYAYGEGMSVVPQATEIPTAEPTAIPTEIPTAEPTEVPTPDPTEIPDQDEDNFAVTPDSPKESIQYVQQMMIDAGLLSAGSDDGVYGSGTAAAMKKFQLYVNATFGAGTVPEDGMGDSITLSYLEAFVDRGMTMPADPTAKPEVTEEPAPEPTAEPVPEPTEIPGADEEDSKVDANSPKESIQHVQQLLIEAGLLGRGSDDGVYGNGTAAAVLEFQQYVNQTFGAGTVPEDGAADFATLSYLEEFVSRGMTMPSKPTEAPATAEPTAAPAAEVALQIGGTQMVNGVHALTGDRITFQWGANVPSEYYIYVTDGNGDSFYSDEATDNTQGVFGAAELTPGMVYTIEIGALPLNGGEGEMAWTTARFGVPGTKPTEVPLTPEPAGPGVIETLKLAINGESPSGIVQVTGDSVSFQWGATGDLEYYTVVVEDNSGARLVNWPNTLETKGALKASQLTPGEVYTIAISAVPTNGGEIVWTEARFGVPASAVVTPAPEYNPVSAPAISIDGPAYTENGVQYLTGSSAIFTWMSTGDVKGYMLYMLNSAGERLDFDPTTKTSMTLPLGNLPVDTYTLFVGAVPATATSEAEVIWSSLVFSVGSAD